MTRPFEYVRTEISDGVVTITLDRPEKLNAFAGTMRQEVAQAVRDAAVNRDARVLIITGAGRAFSAGADVAYMRELLDRHDVAGFTDLVEVGREVVTEIRAVEKPVIAAVNGPAAGGGANLALACDIRIASDRASIGETFNRIGLHPDWGGTYFLPRIVGAAKALELIFTADLLGAAEAHRIGIFNRVVPHETLMSEARALALRLVAKPARALALAKRAVYASEGRVLAAQLDVELEHQLECFDTDDVREGLRAFLEKRAANFGGT